MAKSTLSFVCQNCGAAYNRWQGKCESCGEWNTLVEEDVTGATTMPVSIRSKRKGRLFALESLTGKSVEAPRLPSGMAELDRVTGGGFVRGSVLLVGGDPGIGKSTLLTQATSLMARAGHRAVYISGEEAVAQVRLRAERLGLADAPVQLAAETSVEDIVSTLSEGAVPRLIVIDSENSSYERGALRHQAAGFRWEISCARVTKRPVGLEAVKVGGAYAARNSVQLRVMP